MQTIKFKAKRLDNGEWVEGFYANIEEKEHYILQRSVLGLLWTEINYNTLCRYIGARDVNEVEMFIGDTISDGCRIGEIAWDEQYLELFILWSDTSSERMTIEHCKLNLVGNIYEKER